MREVINPAVVKELVAAIAAHDKWFRARVQEALDDTAPTIPDGEVKAHFAAKRAALQARLAEEKGRQP